MVPWRNHLYCYHLERSKFIVKVKVTQSCPTLCDLRDFTVHGILQARILEWVAFPFSRGSSQPRDQTQVLPHCRWILYQLSHKGKPKNTAVGSLSLLQQIFPTQELNRDLLHCSQILYQLSYEGSQIHSKQILITNFHTVLKNVSKTILYNILLCQTEIHS